MFCTQCGTKNEPGTRFCMNCGHPFDVEEPAATAGPAAPVAPAAPAPVPTPEAAPQPAQPAQPPQPVPAPAQPAPVQPAPAPAQPQPAAPAPAQPAPVHPQPAPSAPQPVQPAASPEQAAPAEPAKPAKPRKRHGKLIAAILAVVLVIAAGGAGAYLTWRQGLWGGVVLPQASDVKVEAGQQLTADIVVDQLKAKGVTAQKKTMFSGQPKGAFVGYDGLKPGDRVSKGQTVTVQESAGPGVPDDVIGKQAADVKSTIDGMNVPVKYKQIIVNDTSKTPEGSVVVTYPAAGQPVSDKDKDKGIAVGVAVKGDGVGWDIIGQDKDSAKSDLESKGYDVTVVPRLASKDSIGKVTGSKPEPGSTIDGMSVTLYYGVDAKGVQDAYSYDSPEVGHKMLIGNSDLAAGTWCTNAGDCITLDGDGETYDGLGYMGGITYDQGRDGTKYSYGTMTSCPAGMSDPYCENDAFLLKQNVGAFELMPSESVYNFSCNGTMQDSGTCSGTAEYRMQDFFLVVPTGTDIGALESKGYFDQSALDAAKGQKAVDSDRPYLLYRDPKLYDTTTAPYTDASSPNPFIPANMTTNTANTMVGMKPAPSDETAYYLVGAEPDWDKLPDATVGGASASPSASASGSTSASPSASASPSTSKAMSFSDVSSAAKSGDFSGIAGKYCMKDGSVCITIDKSGNATSSGSQGYAYMSPDNPTSVKLHVPGNQSGDSWFPPDSDTGLELAGPLTDYRCGGNKGVDACYNGSTFYSEAEINKPFHAIYVRAGADMDKVGEIGGSSFSDPSASGQSKPDTSKPFLKIVDYHMNVPPLDSNVLYLQQ
ncbi:transmembrane serine/threonine- protein kinase B [Bifidobacterium sp. DSM 109958]|uniref:Transmembrane serine/threonine- protein kinase B n=1 Tax=Bifidobacterium moraviense TaxID=2675323 RepID=A0A7Y0F255_9BIFI|nr:PASTA domain-containing protein [Bifidobacterium sp. DSM 109958]NMN00598.1 transmembrane serine/threonine- protein kinase B [Bifidobacterium sp. DSM 109958]